MARLGPVGATTQSSWCVVRRAPLRGMKGRSDGFDPSPSVRNWLNESSELGLHPLDVEVLLTVLQRLIDNGATVVVIEHDLDMIANADWVVDMGPGGGDAGGRVVATGTPEHIAACPESITGRYIAEELGT